MFTPCNNNCYYTSNRNMITLNAFHLDPWTVSSVGQDRLSRRSLFRFTYSELMRQQLAGLSLETGGASIGHAHMCLHYDRRYFGFPREIGDWRKHFLTFGYWLFTICNEGSDGHGEICHEHLSHNIQSSTFGVSILLIKKQICVVVGLNYLQ